MNLDKAVYKAEFLSTYFHDDRLPVNASEVGQSSILKGLGVSGHLISGRDFRYENFSRVKLYKNNLPPHIGNSAYAPGNDAQSTP